jgi:hypothetical protein
MKQENLDEAVNLGFEAAPENNSRPVDEVASIGGILKDAFAGQRLGLMTERR